MPNRMVGARSAITARVLVGCGVSALLLASCVSLKPIVETADLPPGGSATWAEWYVDQTGEVIEPDQVGVYAIESVGDSLYLGLAGDVSNARDGALVARFDGTSVTALGQLDEQGVIDFTADGDTVLAPGADPDYGDTWLAGNAYEIDATGITKFRDRTPRTLVATTVTGLDGRYTFPGVRETGYEVRFVAPVGTQLTASVGNNVGRAAQTSIDTSDPVPGAGYANVCGPGVDRFTPWTNGRIDAGLVPGSSPITPAVGPPSLAGYVGGSTIGGIVWDDANANSVRDGAETARVGAVVELWSTDPYLPCQLHGTMIHVDETTGVRYATGAVYADVAPVFSAPAGTMDFSYVGEIPNDRAYSITGFGGALYAMGYSFPPFSGAPSTRELWRSTDGASTWTQVVGVQPDFAARPVEFGGQLVVPDKFMDSLVTIGAAGTVTSTVALPFTMPFNTHDLFAVACGDMIYAPATDGGLWRSENLTEWERYAGGPAPIGALHWWEEQGELIAARRGLDANVFRVDPGEGGSICAG